MTTEPTILVDVSNLAFRSFYASPSLSYEGQSTALFHGFLSAVWRLYRLSPHLVFCWDYGTPDQFAQDQERWRTGTLAEVFTPNENWRKTIYPPYKSNRKLTPESALVRSQFPELYRAVESLGFPNIGVPGLEADDIMGILSARNGRFLLHSGDDDLCQLLEHNRVRILRRKKAWYYITQQQIELKYGFPIDRWATYLALGGDDSDCIRPLPRCGNVGAIRLTLAGADCLRPIQKQPQAAQIARWAAPWQAGMVKNAYLVASIPRNSTDPRIRHLIQDHPLPKSLDRKVDSTDDRLEEFSKFCAQYGLNELLRNRYKFFEPQKESNEVRYTKVPRDNLENRRQVPSPASLPRARHL